MGRLGLGSSTGHTIVPWPPLDDAVGKPSHDFTPGGSITPAIERDFMFMAVDHFAFAVSNLDRSLAFYADLLEFEILLRKVWDEEYVRRMVGYPNASLDIALLKLPGSDGMILELIEYQTPVGVAIDSQLPTPGNAHMCLLDGDIDATYSRLLEARVEFISEPVAVTAGPNIGRRAAYFRDPDDIVIQLIEPLEKSCISPYSQICRT